MHRDGQRVTDAALVPIILNTFGAVGTKATEFLYAVAGSEAKRIIDEISLLAVLLSAEMILSSHAPSNLANLLPLAQAAAQNEKIEAAAQPQQAEILEGEEEMPEKDAAGFLRPDLRGEVQGDRVECLGCSSEKNRVFRCGILWNWNRHVLLKHRNVVESAAREDALPDAQPAQQPDQQPPEKPAAPPAQQSATQPARQPAQKKPAAQPALKPAAKRSATGTKRTVGTSAGAIETSVNPSTRRREGGENGRKDTKKRKAAPQPATHQVLHLPAQQAAHLSDVQQCVTSVDFVGASSESASKKPGPVGSRKERTVPSTNPVSKEQQAGMRTNLDSMISSPAFAPTSSNDNNAFSSKNASIIK